MSDQVGNVRGCSLLGEIVGEIETLFEQRRYQECLGLIVENLIEAWYGFDPQSLVRIVRQLIFAGADASGAGKAILQFLTSATPSSRRASPPSNRMKFSDLPFDFMEPLGRMVYLRQRGKALEALGVASDLSQSLENLPLFYDSSRGLRQLVYVQSGISAILAGEFEQALKFFTGAQAHRMMPTLPLVARDAYVKAALIHASFGDFAVSKSLLRQAGGFPRTESWAELTIDASESLARIILSVESAECRDVTIPDIPLQHLGEMWPFYVIALQRVLERNGDRAELINRLEGLQQIRFPRVDGEGFAGSVFPLALAAAHAAAGNMSAVRINIALADPNYVGTKLMRMLYEMLLGNAQRVLILSDQSRRHVAFLR